MRTNDDRTPEEILAGIERTRAGIDQTLAAIERKLRPGELMEQGLDYLRRSGGGEFVSNLGGSVRDNPLPVALVGVGIAWLMASGRGTQQNRWQQAPVGEWQAESTGERPSGADAGPRESNIAADMKSTASKLGERADAALGRASAAASATRDKLAETAQAARDRVHAARESIHAASERAQRTAQTVREQTGRISDTARHQYERARGGFDTMLQEHPLALGAIGLAVGAVIAAAAPRTRKEDELVGPARDRLAERAADLGREQVDEATRAARAAADAVKEAFGDEHERTTAHPGPNGDGRMRGGASAEGAGSSPYQRAT